MISILCPTRKRPENLRRLLDSIVGTMSIRSGLELLCYVDEDDSSYDDFFIGIHDVKFIRGPRITMSCMWDALIPHSRGDLLSMMGDDVVFKTPGWNKIVEEAFAACPDKILLVHGDDLGPGGKVFASLPIVHRKWYDTIGHFAGVGYSCDFADTDPFDIAKILGRVQYLPYITEHLHPAWSKAPTDEVYEESKARYAKDRPDLLYASRLHERQADAEKLRKVMDPTWQLPKK